MSLTAPSLPPIPRPVSSLIAAAQGTAPEIGAFFCVDPVETAADKLSALAWRVHARQRGGVRDDPTIIRHLHDLAALKPAIAASGDFPRLVTAAVAEDTGRAGGASSDPATLLASMLLRLQSDPLWATEYREYVRQVSFADPAELIGFDRALAALGEVVALLPGRGQA